MHHYILADGRLMACTHPIRSFPRRLWLRHTPHYYGAREITGYEFLNASPLEDRRREAMSDKLAIYALMGEHSKDDLLNDVAAQYATYKKTITGDDRIVKASVDTIKHYLTLNVERDITAKLAEMYETYEMFNGPRPAENRSDWDSGLDDEVEKLVEPYISVLSADWLGKHTVDTMLHEEGAIPKFAKALAAEAYKQATAGRTDVQIMSGGGLTMDVVRAALGDVAQAAATAPTASLAGVVEALTAILGGVGAAFDPIEMYDTLDNASDSDDGLALGYIARLVLDADESAQRYYVVQLQNFRTSNPDAVDKLLDMLTNLAANPDAYAEAVAAEAATPKVENVPLPSERKKRNSKKDEAQAPAEPVAGALDPAVLAKIKAHANVKDDDIAKGIGTSRATVNNIVNGKATLAPNEAQTAFLRNLIWSHMDGLREAMSLIDGVEYTIGVSEG